VVTYITKRYQEISVVFPIQPFNLTCELGAEPLFGRTEIDRKVLKMIHPQIQSGLLGFAASCVWFGTPLMWEGLPIIQWSKAMYKLDNVHAQIESYVADVVRSDLWGAEMFFFRICREYDTIYSNLPKEVKIRIYHYYSRISLCYLLGSYCCCN